MCLMIVDVVCGWYRNMLVSTEASDKHLAALGALQIKCLECEGRGIWDYMEPEVPIHACIVCKGTGKVYIGG